MRKVLCSVVVVMVASVLCPWGALAQEGYTPIPVIKGINALKVGSKAPLFQVKDSNGVPFDLGKDIGKKAFLLVFWSIFCEPCRDEMPVVERIQNQYKDKGLEVLAINLDGEPFREGVVGFIKQGKYSFRVLMDELQEEMFKIADPYNVAGTPVVYFITKKGEIGFHILGRVSADDLVEKVAQAMATP